MQRRRRLALAASLSLAITVGAASAFAAKPPPDDAGAQSAPLPAKPALDRTGKKRVGTASVYSRRFVGRPMADGRPMDARDDNAASKSLPLGTKAEVTNLKTGQSATVTIEDRGPYVKGRIVDLSPATADKIGITPKEGVAKVEVKPISVPPPEAEAKN
jgi:rare lipoprotein A